MIEEKIKKGMWEEKIKKEMLEERHSNWIKSGPSTLVREMVGLINETNHNYDIVLSQEAAMMACVESKRNDVLKEISESLSIISRDTESFPSIEGIANILSRMEQAVKRL